MLEFLFNRAAGLKGLLKRDFNTGVFLWNLQNFFEHLFLQKSFSCYFCGLTDVFKGVWSKSWCDYQQQIPGSAEKKYFLSQKSRRSHRRCSGKEGLLGPSQVFSCEYCEIFKNTYFEKHLWTAASENQDFSDKFTEGRYFLNFIILLIKAFSI